MGGLPAGKHALGGGEEAHPGKSTAIPHCEHGHADANDPPVKNHSRPNQNEVGEGVRRWRRGHLPTSVRRAVLAIAEM